MKKVGHEQSVDDNSRNSKENVNKNIEVYNTLFRFQNEISTTIVLQTTKLKITANTRSNRTA